MKLKEPNVLLKNGTITTWDKVTSEMWLNRFFFDMIYWMSLNIIISEVIFGTIHPISPFNHLLYRNYH
jgi:hypothetical protein